MKCVAPGSLPGCVPQFVSEYDILIASPLWSGVLRLRGIPPHVRIGLACLTLVTMNRSGLPGRQPTQEVMDTSKWELFSSVDGATLPNCKYPLLHRKKSLTRAYAP